MPLRDRIEAAVAEYRDDECVVLPDVTLTYGELDRLTNATANALVERGVREGSVVMTLCHNGAALVATWFACMKIGAVFAPLNASLTGDPLAHVMSLACGEALICDAALAPAARAASQDVSTLTVALVTGARSHAGFASLDHAVAAASTDPPPMPEANPAAPARLMFTSGTTGDSKGVLWSRNAETLHAVCYGDELVRTARGETVYTCLPLFHVTAQGTLLGTMAYRRRPAVRATPLLGADPSRRCRLLSVCGNDHQHPPGPRAAPHRLGQPGTACHGERHANRPLGCVRAPLRRGSRGRLGSDRDRVLLDPCRTGWSDPWHSRRSVRALRGADHESPGRRGSTWRDG
jgi:hypothetical protein